MPSTAESQHMPAIADTAIRAERIFLFESEDDLLVTSRKASCTTAHEVQQRLLPTRPPKVKDYKIDTYCQPALEVGGDHFNFFSAGGDSLGVLIADVSGKGMPAALLATLLRATFRTQTWGNHDVASVMTRANNFLSRVLPPGTFITATYGILDVNARRFSFVRAGHEPLLYLPSIFGAELMAPAGLPLGIVGEEDFNALIEPATLHLAPGDTIFLFTDGLTEAMNPAREEFGTLGILDALRNPEANIIESMQAAFKRHCDGEPPHDDVTMVSITLDKSAAKLASH